MARRRQAPPAVVHQASVVLPFELAFNCSGRPWDERHRDRDEWLREHGVVVDDRAAVAAVVAASRRAYGATDALSRARVMAERRPLT